MKLKTLPLLLLLFFSANTFSQEKIKGNKNVITIETEVNSFNKISVGEKFNVSLIKDDNASVEVKTDENLHDVIRFNVADSTLSFKTTQKITASKKLEIVVRYTSALKEIEVKDDAEIESLNTITNNSMILKIQDDAQANLNFKTNTFKLINNNDSRLKLSSKSKLNIYSKMVNLEFSESSKTDALITCDTLKVDMYQRATANIEGDAKYLKATAINSANFIGKNLTVKTCELATEDSSDFSIQATENILIEASGSSEVKIYGNPKITIEKFSDTAKLSKKEL